MKRIIPAFLIRALIIRHDIIKLQKIQKLQCQAQYLKPVDDISKKELFASHEMETGWSDIKKKMDMFAIPDGTGGVNPGEGRAIYYLIRKFKPSSVLEVGTHIGASTLHIASALYRNKIEMDGKNVNLVSVDIADVNDPVSKPWLKHGTILSPIEMITKMNFGDFVEFVTDTSVDYFARCEWKFDFIFLDGEHTAKAVYSEIPAALNLLNKDGLILLHDYFPNLKPLWSDGSVTPGPFLAMERLKHEGASLVVLPLGELPWPTKLQSNMTNLALLLRNDH